MKKQQDPRLDATRKLALEAALTLLQEQGALAVTHGTINAQTGISRSTLYRHWPKLDDLRNAAFMRAASGRKDPPPTDGPLRADLKIMLGALMNALNETPWGKIAPQLIAAAATDAQSQKLINKWIEDRKRDVKSIFLAAKERGELSDTASIDLIVEMSIAVPYFRKLVAGIELDADWLETHIDMICNLANKPACA